MKIIKNFNNWRFALSACFLLVGIFLAWHQVLAVATNVSISSPNALSKAYAQPNSTIPVLFYVTADPPGFSAFYNIYLSKNSSGYTYHEYSGTFYSGGNGYSQDFNVGNPGDGLYDININVPDVSDQNTSAVVVDGTPPTTPTVIYPSAAGIYLKPSNPVLIRWTASTDANFGSNPIKVVYSLAGNFLDGVVIANLPATATSTTWNPPNVSSATVKVAVVATDLAGNTTSDASNNAFALDNQAPTVDAGTISSTITSPTQPGASASDNISSAVNLTYAWGVLSAPSGGLLSFSNANILNPYLSGTVTGDYTASLVVTDQAGNYASDTVTFHWDGNPRDFSVTAPVNGDYLRGGSAANITWTNPGDSDLNHFKVEYSDDEGNNWNLIANNIASSTLVYSWSVPSNNSANNMIRVTAYDNDGNSTSAFSGYFTIDSTPPAVSVLTPNASGINLKGGASYNITWSAADTNLDTNNVVLAYSSNNGSSWTNIATTTNSGTYSWTVSGPETIAGLIRVTAVDLAGNSSSDASDNVFVVDNNGPVITISTPNLGAISVPTASGASASDAYSGVSSYSWAKVSGPGTITFSASASIANPTLSASVDGSYVARLTVTDNVGNLSTADVSFVWDTTNPTVTTPNLGAIKTATASGATASDANGIASYSWTKVSGPGTITFSASANILNPTISANVDGAYSAQLTVVDNAGNSNSSTMTFTWDTTNPTVTTPNLGAIKTATASGATASDANGIASYSWTKVSGPGTITFSASANILNPTISANVDGAYSAQLTVVDNAGNSNSSTMTFTWDTTNPTVTTPNLGAISVPTASGATASDANGIASYSWTKVSGPGTITFSASANILNPTISANVDGAYSAQLTVVDNAGNSNSSTMTFTWDTTAPVITIVPISPDPTGDATPTFTGTSTDALINISSVEYQVDGGSWTACSAADGSFNSLSESYTCTIAPALADGLHTVYVRSSDTLGNTSDGSVSDSFTVDLSGPTVAAMADREENAQFSQDATTTGATSWQWTYTGPGTITFGSATAEDTTISADTDGSYTITLTATDSLSRTDSASFTLLWDTTAPVITIVPISPDPTGDATPTFTGTSTDALINISSVEYQ
ncbi:MAG: Ig-like domain-containing protein, partial [Patescibacteria group bacterium]|nr:Ig-like domain-containing protein [Patescibacteria group bacterium]